MARKYNRYWHNDIELESVRWVSEREIADYMAYEPDFSKPRVLAGHMVHEKGTELTWGHLKWWPVTRQITVVATGKPHNCDWRCEGAYKHTECRCVCQGKNHGIRGNALECN